ncbi:MAG: glycosyltransferase involved in cell wall biosynthesis [Rubritalea sp.]|jgi:glycosyltransferase involved in cell wall biosynthesis
MKKILVSAYACNPYLGSEPGVGWTAVCRIARDHKVYVLADANHKVSWEKARSEEIIPANIEVKFIRKPTKYLENRFIARIQSWLWYTSFNRLVLSAAQEWHEEQNFDLCHQVTIAAWRLPSPLWRLPIPFIWGPIGGAGYIPKPFRSMLSPAARVFECVRDIQTFIASRSSTFKQCMNGTSVILAANRETLDFLKPFRNDRPLFWLPIVSISSEKAEQFKPDKNRELARGPLRLFVGGNIEGRKGVSLALKALAKVKFQGISFHYTIAGGGPEISSLKALTRKLDLNDNVTFHPGYSGKAYIEALQDSEVYFLPSFRESTPVTLLEAYLANCYPVVADTSAQGEIVKLAGGKAVAVNNVNDLIEGLADAIKWCSQNRDELPVMAEVSRKEILKRFSTACYEKTLSRAYEINPSKL